MHLKNFSLYRPSKDYQLAPAYDLLNTTIANPKDKEELAMTLSGRKSKLCLDDFLNIAKTIGLDKKIVLHLVKGFEKSLPKWKSLIESSFLDEDIKKEYNKLIISRLHRLQR